ncbi:MAG: replication-associated recombination protein A [Candidatus Moraniibacteriota bacterium]|nr:MAG: replication-associated recombination protein A [Candidatus Moranbacteria bacterium]
MGSQRDEIAPLAERMRPRTFDEFSGQSDIVGESSFLRNAVLKDQVPSLIFWGPPGTGKTTLARIVASETKGFFVHISATSSGKKVLQSIVEKARKDLENRQKTFVFIDEIHRWNKAQQDALLPSVEDGTVILIGATTENPSFEVNSALLSRCRVIILRRLEDEALFAIVSQALQDNERGLGTLKLEFEEGILELLVGFSHGDARYALNALEACSKFGKKITKKILQNILQTSHLLYDKKGEEHFNIISALHKSMRGGDANASVYWMTRMLEGGEDPLYVARRLVRFASEDIGLANNTALLLANAVFDACHKLGMPECGVHLAQCVIYLANSPKSVVAYDAYTYARKDVLQYGNLPVPLHLRNAPTKFMKDIGYGVGYKYTPKEKSENQRYLPDELTGRNYTQGSL